MGHDHQAAPEDPSSLETRPLDDSAATRPPRRLEPRPLDEPPPSTPAPDGGRFKPGAPLGAGSMGTVVRAFDEVRRHDVALKYLKHVDPDALYRFKQEFRSLAGVIHPNIVTLYELAFTGDRWAVAMELVDEARTFLDYVRPYRHWLRRSSEVASGSAAGTSVVTSARGDGSADPSRGRSSLPDQPVTVRLPDHAVVPEPSHRDPPGALSKRAAIIAARLNPERLRSALLQLTEGLDAVHQRGMLHRDIKPSNVLVDQSGRVVVCDFGLVASAQADESRLVGTPAYMSPEQAEHRSLTSASDFYAVGVMLYEALTGQRPVSCDSISDLLAAKRTAQIRPPSELDPSVDPKLEALCMSLLELHPEHRPDAAAIRAIVGGLPTSTARVDQTATRRPFIGRTRERARLLGAFADARAGRAVAVLVSGPSGVGKSALVAEVCEQLRAEHDAIVLRGRCYPNESVPFKAVDAVVDAITDHLMARPIEQVGRLIPDAGELVSLCALFPVLRRAAAVAIALERSSPAIPPSRVRPLAQRGLQQLVGALARERPVVIAIDDLQWGDRESAPVLRELIESPDSPGVLVLGTRRNESTPRDDDGSSLVSALEKPRPGELEFHHDLRHLELESLDSVDGADLVRTIAGASLDRAVVTRLLEDAEGHPMFVIELAYAARDGEMVAGAEGLDALIERRIASLSPPARRLVEAAATAEWPQPLDLLSRALGLDQEAATLAQLVAARMIRIVSGPDGERITTYHDRVREVAQARLSEPSRRRLHRKLALAFEQAPELDLEALALHWHEAGDQRRAIHYLVQAGDRAMSSRAFGRAAHQYQRALALDELTGEPRQKIQLDLAHSLYRSGSFREAADAYARAAEAKESAEAALLRGRALTCILHSGDIARAGSFARTTGRGVGVRIPEHRLAILMSVAWGRLMLAIRKPRIGRLRALDSRDEAAREKLNVLRDTTAALAASEPLASFAIHSRYLRTAVRAGDPLHLVHALTQEAVFLCLLKGTARQEEVAVLLDQATIAVEATRNRSYAAFVEGRRAVCRFLQTRKILEAGQNMEAAATETSRELALAWDADIFQMYAMNAYGLAGAFNALSTALPAMLKRATESNNGYVYETVSRQPGLFVHLAHDRPDLARDLIERGRPATDKMNSAEWAFQSRSADIEIYAEGWPHAAERVEQLWQRVKGTSTASVPLFGITTASMRGRMSATLAALDEDERPRHLARARAMRAVLGKFRRNLPHYARGHAALVDAMIAAAEGDLDGAVAGLRRAIEDFAHLQMRPHEMPARIELGRLLKGDEGAALERQGRDWMSQEGIVRPERFTSWQCPLSLIREASRPWPSSRSRVSAAGRRP